MIAQVIASLLALLVPDHTVHVIRANFPDMTNDDDAREHAGAAVLAAAVSRVDVETVLAIAAHESRGSHVEATAEPPDPVTGQPRWSCGVMTPEPITDRRECDRIRSSVAAGYLAGAAHLASWLRTCRGNRTCALQGYAGAWTVRDRCGLVDAPRSCIAAAWFARRALWIRRALSAPSHRKEPTS